MFGSGKAGLLRRPKEAYAVIRTTQLVRQVAGEKEPVCAALRVGGQLSGSLEGRDRNVAGAAKLCPVRRGLELFSDSLVRPGC